MLTHSMTGETVRKFVSRLTGLSENVFLASRNSDTSALRNL